MNASQKNTVLLVEDTVPLARIYENYLREAHYDVVHAGSGKKALQLLDQSPPGVMLLDLTLPDIKALDVFEHCHQIYPGLPVIIMAANDAAETAMEAVKRGAYDFIMKPFPGMRLATALRNAFRNAALTDEIAEWRRLVGHTAYRGFVGQSPAMQALYRFIESVADTRASVLLRGESGTGKELAARAIHDAGPRRLKPFIILNCAATSRDLIEAMLFGLPAGSFPDADFGPAGALRNAAGGSLFLKEICEMPLKVQARLLQFLQGGLPAAENPEENDIRVIASTSRDPAEEIAHKRLDENVYRHLQPLSFEMPPLRDRDGDIMDLATHFLQRFGEEEGKKLNSLSPEVMRAFRRHEWPGNVRQLENLIRDIVIHNDGTMVTERMLPDNAKAYGRTGKPVPASGGGTQELELVELRPADSISPLWVMEMDAITQALEYTHHDIAQAAALLEVSPAALYRKIRMWQNPEDLIAKTAKTA